MKSRLFLVGLSLGGPFAVLLGAWWFSVKTGAGVTDQQRRLRKETALLALVAGVAIAVLQLMGTLSPALDPWTRSSVLQQEGSVGGVLVALALAVLLLVRFEEPLPKEALYGSFWRVYGRFFGFLLGGWLLRFPFALLGFLIGEGL